MSADALQSPVVEPGLFQTDPPALLGGRCAACATLRFPHRAVCGACQGAEVEPVPLSHAGTIHTFTVVRRKPPGYLGEAPYAFGFVELPEGLRVISTILADDLEALTIGDPVHFELLTLGTGPDAVLSYCFRKREDSR